MIALKVYRDGLQVLVAACDEELLDQTFHEGQFRLEVSGHYYDGVRVSEDELQQALRGATMANLAGPRAVAAAVAVGAISADGIAEVAGVPHATLVMI